MVESNRQRPVIDLDELERQLRAAAGPRDRAQTPAPSSDDPLAELARIVGQEEPGRAYWNGQPDTQGRPGARQAEPSFDDLVAHAHDHHGYEAQPHSRAGQATESWEAPAAVPDDWSLRTSSRDDRYAPPAEEARAQVDEGEPVYEPEGQLPPHAGGFEEAAKPAPKRRGWLAMGALLSVAVVGVAGAVVMRSPSGTKVASGTPPLIKADTAPSKVQPDNPGGTEVPNQDSQVYAKGGPEDVKNVRVVGGEEQPVDVAQLTRKDVPIPAAVAPAAPATTTSPAVDHSPVAKPAVAVVPGLGEARRVKTVSVRPDGTIIDAPVAAPAPEPAPASPARVASLMPTMEMPAAVGAPPGGAKPKPATTATTASTTPTKPKPADGTAAAVQAGTSPAAAPAAAPKPPKPTQVASAATEDATASAGGGGFAVQLAAPASEQEARDASSRLQKRFAAELGDRKPIIRKADVNGKTIYRVRVSGLGKDEATELCTKLQSSGGQCFVAKN